ncbi:receptor-type tyrosine-protein phosphatase S-like [Dreissena polymorpha]|uniref:receptor-type tyrosine-protein phosphatase S-like n=1 Tax=Dreissena polymorpha TaxID=45954 RepID=UPI002263C274|nr:receptor-type tyrosine-protein phosphatase S-like [Dreissena polymorpha]
MSNTSVVDDEKMIAVLLPKAFLCNDFNGESIQWGVVVAQDSAANEASFVGSLTEYQIFKDAHYTTWSDVKDKSVIQPYVATSPEWRPLCAVESKVKVHFTETDMNVKDHNNKTVNVFASKRRRRDANVSDTHLIFVIGNEHCLNNQKYCNGPLHPGRSYRVKSYACTTTGCTETLYSLPIWTGDDRVSAPVSKVLNDITVLGGCAGAVVCIALVVAIVCIKRSNKLCFKSKMTDHRAAEVNIYLNDLDYNMFRPGRVNITDFPAYVDQMHKSDNRLFRQAYKMLKDKNSVLPITAALSEGCLQKNRFVDILPFDHSRVKLRQTDDVDGANYINANYIPGYKSRGEYIATQGPLRTTFEDFWRMIWEQKVDIIVMLTNLVEKGKFKCDMYWPDNEQVFYGNLLVSKQSERDLSFYKLRIFEIKLNKERRSIKHFWFIKWPDAGCPEKPKLFLEFVQAVQKARAPAGNGCPFVVHCSDGVGRTGTFIAVDHLLQHIRDHEDVDIFQLVLDIREHRCNMVQTEAQFVFIYDCLKAFLTVGHDSDGHLYQNTHIETEQKEHTYEALNFRRN